MRIKLKICDFAENFSRPRGGWPDTTRPEQQKKWPRSKNFESHWESNKKHKTKDIDILTVDVILEPQRKMLWKSNLILMQCWYQLDSGLNKLGFSVTKLKMPEYFSFQIKDLKRLNCLYRTTDLLKCFCPPVDSTVNHINKCDYYTIKRNICYACYEVFLSQ